MIVEAKVVRGSEYKQQRQFLSGFHVGYERKDCWRVAIRTGRRWFHSTEIYANEASARKAAAALVRKVVSQ